MYEFIDMKIFIRDFIEAHVDLAPRKDRVGLATFSDRLNIRFHLDQIVTLERQSTVLHVIRSVTSESTSLRVGTGKKWASLLT